jgi:antibiotic biosynthesis monooxygenase (ABM) superfamily enzyme
MIFLTQLIYVHPGKEAVFEEFEAVALPLMQKHRGELLMRLRPAADAFVAGQFEPPYEVHIVRFASDQDFAAFSADPERQQLLHLKSESVRSMLLLRGAAI